MLTRERNPFDGNETEASSGPGLMERARALYERVLEFFAPSQEPGSAVGGAYEAEDEEIDETGAIKPRRRLAKFIEGLWYDPLFVRLPFEERRMGLILAALLSITLYVAFLSIAVNAVFAHAAAGMSGDGGARMTFEVMADPAQPNEAREKQSRAATVIERLKTVPGVENVSRIGDDKMAQLLSPWLGTAAPPPDLPLPALIDVELNPRSPPSKEALGKVIEDIPGVMIDDHAGWEQALKQSARALEFTALYVLLLGFVALALTACFAAETHFHINRDTIEILHLIGARDSAIARHMGIAVLRLAFVAAAGAFVLALATLLVLWLCMRGLDLSFFPNFSISALGWVAIVLQWLLTGVFAAGFCFAAAYLTVLRALQRLI